MTFKLGAAVHRALLECDTVEEVAEVFEAVKESRIWTDRIVADDIVDPEDPRTRDTVRAWFGLPPIMMHESPPCQFHAAPHFDALARHGAIDTNSMMFRLLKLARQERGRIEKNAFLPRRVKDDVRRRHGEMLKEARAFRSFPDYRRIP